MEKIALGIIGFGRIGAEHAGWIGRSQGISVAAIADETPARRALAESRGLRTFESPDALLKDPDISAILVASPTSMHFEHALAALQAGKHVMVEKPMTLDLPQSRRLADEAAARGRVLSVFHNRRWDIDYLTVQQAIASGRLGRVFNVESRLGQWASCVGPAAPQWRPQWRNEAAYGGGGLYDWGSHFLDQLWRLMLPAKPARLFAQLRGNVWSNDCDDFARVCIDFDNGAVGLLEINTTTTRPLPRWHVDGSTGSADSPFSLDFDTHHWAQLEFTPSSGVKIERLPLAATGLDEVSIWDQFAAATQGHREPAVRVETVLPTMALLDAARQSSREGCAAQLRGGPDFIA